jgi:hypothetical protein
LAQTRYQLDITASQDRVFKADALNVGYKLEFKPSYDGITDYGPSSLSARSNDEQIRLLRDHAFRHDTLPWQAYATVSTGPWLTLRFGRQRLNHWGQAHGFRILDMTEPVDSRLGSIFLERDSDTLIPLWAITGSVGRMRLFGQEIDSFDFYFVPGVADTTRTPIPSLAGPFAPDGIPRPEDLGSHATVIGIPKNLRSSRGGAQVQFRLLNTQISLVHYCTFNDVPALQLQVKPLRANLSTPCNLRGTLLQQLACVEQSEGLVRFYQQNITGTSLSFQGLLPFVSELPMVGENISQYLLHDSVLGYIDAAMFWSERVSLGRDNSIDNLLGMIAASELTQKTAVTAAHHRDVGRYVVGMTIVPQRLPFLTQGVDLTGILGGNFQFQQSHIFNYSRDITEGVNPDKSNFKATVPVVGANHVSPDDFVVTGALGWFPLEYNPADAFLFSFASGYDARKLWVLVPGAHVDLGSVKMDLLYANVSGHWFSAGLYKGRDVLTLRLSLELVDLIKKGLSLRGRTSNEQKRSVERVVQDGVSPLGLSFGR